MTGFADMKVLDVVRQRIDARCGGDRGGQVEGQLGIGEDGAGNEREDGLLILPVRVHDLGGLREVGDADEHHAQQQRRPRSVGHGSGHGLRVSWSRHRISAGDLQFFCRVRD